MAACATCGKTILFGGVCDGAHQYCNTRCHAQDQLGAAAREIPEHELMAEVEHVHAGACPRCGGTGPVDVHVSHTVWSVIVLSSARSAPAVCCRQCGTRAQLGGAASSAALGWWGFPWGLILTPIQIARNIGGLLNGPDLTRASSALIERVCREMAVRRLTEEPPAAGFDTIPGVAPPASTAPVPVMAAAPSRSGSLKGLLTTAAIVLLLAGGIYSAVAAAKTPRCWLVNGLDRPYDVTVDGVAYRLVPFARKRIEFREGSIDVVVNDPNLAIAPQTAVVESPFLARPIRDDTFVINPDGTALLLWEQAVYKERPSNRPEHQDSQHLAWNGLVSSYEGIDFLFAPLPDEIETSSYVERRERISLANRQSEPAALAFWMETEHGTDAAVAWLMRRIAIDVDDAAAVHALSDRMEPDAFRSFAEHRLAERPVRIDWHQAYQETRRSNDTTELIAEYRAILDREPDNADLMYLLGGVIEDPDEQDAMFRRAIAADDPTVRAHAALAFNHLVNGRYDEARAAMDVYVQLADVDERTKYQFMVDEIHHATGDFEPLHTAAAAAYADDPTDLFSAGSLVYYLARLGRETEARHRINGYLRASEGRGHSEASRAHGRAMLELTIASAKADVDGFVRIARSHPELGFASDAELLTGDPGDAAKMIDDFGTWQPAERFMVFCVASLRNRANVAEAELAKALDLTAEFGDPGWRRVAAWIESGTSPSDKEVRSLSLLPTHKRVALLALGCRFPEDRDRHWAMADSLNYDRHWPYLSMRLVLDGDTSRTTLAE